MILLESTRLFGSLAPGELELIRSAVQLKAFATGQEIFVEGEPGDGIYIVQQGVIEISVLLDPGSRLILARLGEGEVFGELSVMDQEPRSATATAAQDTQVYFIPREQLMEMLQTMPGLTRRFVREISWRLRDFNGQYIREVLQTERLALVGRFASSIVHDLKNPLGIIGIAAERAGEEKATPEIRAASRERILQQVERIGGMANELLEFARGSQPSMTWTPVNFTHFVERFLGDLSVETGLNSVQIEVQSPPPSVAVRIDPARLSRVFHNLIRNAIDAMPGGGKMIFRFVADQRGVTTEIEDTGPGVSPTMAAQLFEPFMTHGKSHGTGLGLTICKRIVEDHHGQIYSRTEPGCGAIFGFTLPIQPE